MPLTVTKAVIICASTAYWLEYHHGQYLFIIDAQYNYRPACNIPLLFCLPPMERPAKYNTQEVRQPVAAQVDMNSMKLVIPLHFISWVNSFSDISRKCILPNMIGAVVWNRMPNNAVTPQRQSQFTPKMKANAVPRLLSSLVWIDQDMSAIG